jgi:hypothetical protein
MTAPGRRRGAGARRLRLALAVAALAMLPAACSDTVGPRPAPETPHLGLVPNPSDFDYADSLGSAILTSRALGATMVQLGDLWSALETAPGAIDVAALRAALPLFRSLGLEPYYNLRVLDTNNRGVPADLAGVPFDDPRMIERVDAVVDSLIDVAKQTPLLAFSFGNEVDVYLSQHPAELPAYRALLARERARIRAALPDLKVGCCTSSPVGNAAAWVGDTLNAYTDIVIYTYYPFVPGSDFVHRPPSTFELDMAAMLARAGLKPLGLQEVGYTSSPVNGSSPAAQAEVVRRFRAYMRLASRERILFANWFLMTDWSSLTLAQLFAYYGAYSPGFGAFLGNLGLRDTVGTPKPAWSAWRGLP